VKQDQWFLGKKDLVEDLAADVVETAVVETVAVLAEDNLFAQIKLKPIDHQLAFFCQKLNIRFQKPIKNQ
jgi:hypothetical protein